MRAKAAALSFALAVHTASGGSVPQWGRFETAVHNPKPYTNPFAGVSLEAAFTSPNGKTVRFRGFYDGGDVWKLRFMPDAPGTWTYRSVFSDGTPGPSGSFECIPSDLPGPPVPYETNPIWFGTKNGEPLAVRSFHVGDRFFANRPNAETGEAWSDSLRAAFLDWAGKQGYNMLSIASHYLNRNSAGRGKGWNTPRLWNFGMGVPVPSEYGRMEAVLDDLARRRMFVFPFAGFLGRDSEFPRDTSGQRLYISYTLARLVPYWNLLFSVGGPEPLLKGRPYLDRDEIEQTGHLIRILDPFGHALSCHNATGDDAFRDSRWSDFGVLQGPKTLDRGALATRLLSNHHYSKPLVAQETLWPGNTQGHPPYGDADIRKNALVILFSGACLNFADMAGNSSTGFSGSMDLSVKVQRRHDIAKAAWDLFESFPYHRMKPRQGVSDKGFCLAEPGRCYLVYVEDRYSVRILLEEGTYEAVWINAQNPSDRVSAGIVPVVQTLSPPDRGDDWLLWIEVER